MYIISLVKVLVDIQPPPPIFEGACRHLGGGEKLETPRLGQNDTKTAPSVSSPEGSRGVSSSLDRGDWRRKLSCVRPVDLGMTQCQSLHDLE